MTRYELLIEFLDDALTEAIASGNEQAIEAALQAAETANYELDHMPEDELWKTTYV
jgi:hypothetical protein